MAESAYGKDIGDPKARKVGGEVGRAKDGYSPYGKFIPRSLIERKLREEAKWRQAIESEEGAALDAEEADAQESVALADIIAKKRMEALREIARRKALEEKKGRISAKAEGGQEKKMEGAGFWMIVGLAVVKDGMDLAIIAIPLAIVYPILGFVDAAELVLHAVSWAITGVAIVKACIVGVGFGCLAAPVLISVRHYAVKKLTSEATSFAFQATFQFWLAIISFGVSSIGFLIVGIIYFYFWYAGIRFSTRMVVRSVIALAVEIIPVVSLLPMTTVMVLLTRHHENKAREKKRGSVTGGFATLHA